jgi:hypothetical protein
MPKIAFKTDIILIAKFRGKDCDLSSYRNALRSPHKVNAIDSPA